MSDAGRPRPSSLGARPDGRPGPARRPPGRRRPGTRPVAAAGRRALRPRSPAASDPPARGGWPRRRHRRRPHPGPHLRRASGGLIDQIDAAILRAIARIRTPWLTDVFKGIDRIGLGLVGHRRLALALIVALLVFRRWRHLFTFLGGVLLIQVVGVALIDGFRRPRPYDVTILDRWKGFSFPSAPVAVVTILVVGYLYTLVVAGRPRSQAKIVGRRHRGRLLLRPALPGASTTRSTRSWLGGAGRRPSSSTPSASSRPTRSSRSSTAGARRPTSTSPARGARPSATPLRDQLGLTVLEIKPVGLAGSGGSTPLRLRVAGDPDTYLFGKLYAMNHVRADRWYKLGRTILYGRLEDEAPFQSVRRLVSTRTTRCAWCATPASPPPAPYGIVEMTPEREYLLVTEFFDGAVEIGEAEVDDDVIDQGLAADPPAVGRRPGPPRHQARQPAGPRRRAARSSTWRSCRSARRRGARPSTWPT